MLLGESVDNGGYIHVSIDNVAAAKAATEHLLAGGRTRIAAIGVMPNLDTQGPAARRLSGYINAYAAAGQALPADLIYPTDTWTRASGYAIACSIVEQHTDIDAIFCFNDLLALGVMKALQNHGIRTPQDIAVIGWDDIEECTYATPTLTSISPDKIGIAQLAINHLLNAIAGTPSNKTELLAQYHLALRESTGDADTRTDQHRVQLI